MKKIKSLMLFTVLILASCATTPSATSPAEPTTAVVQLSPTSPPPSPTASSTAQPTATNHPTATPPPTETAAPTATNMPAVPRFSVEGLITIYGEEAAVANDNLGPTGTGFADPGAVLFHNGQYHMFINGFTGWPVPVDIIYAVSDDGRNWTLPQKEAVFEGEDLPFVGIAALASSAIVTEDGTWILYFYTWDDPTWPVSESKIGLATAPSPLGPWTAQSEPILVPGDSGEWDELAVRTPSVQKTDEGYVMFYSGHTRQTAAIGRATSPDGLTWTKSNDPTTADNPHQDSDPIFVGSGTGWDEENVYQPRLQKTPDGWVMLYTSATNTAGANLSQKHGLAISQDGVNWVRSDTAVFSPSDVKSTGRNIWFTELTYANEIYTIFFELGTGGETEIYVATFNPTILPK